MFLDFVFVFVLFCFVLLFFLILFYFILFFISLCFLFRFSNLLLSEAFNKATEPNNCNKSSFEKEWKELSLYLE